MAKKAKQTQQKRAPRGRLSQTDKVSKRLRGISGGVGIDIKKAVHTVNVYAKNVPVTLPGFLVSSDESAVVFRHKKTSASKKTVISTFFRENVISVFGKPGEPSALTYIGQQQINSLKGQVRRDPVSGAVTVKDHVTGEITVIYPNDNIIIQVFADETEKSPVRRKTKKKQEEDFDEEDEDLDEDDEDEDDDDEDDEDLDDEDDDDDEDDEDEDDEDEDVL